MSRLENVIAALSPEWAARRAAARARLRAFRNEYDFSKIRRSADGWLAPSTSANAEVGRSMTVTRNRARDLVRNNQYAARIVDVWVAHLVGDGITCAWVNPDGSADQARQQAFSAWANDGECDADGQLDFYGLQQLAVRAMVQDGEVLIRKRLRRLSDGLTIPFQLQVLEADHLDESKNEVLKGGGVIIQGVQFSALGKREGYWLFRNHPGDNLFAFQRTSVFVAADQIIHLYRKKRPGQVRGLTWLAASGNKIKDTGDVQEAVIMKAKIESLHVGAITTPEDNEGPAVGEVETETDDEGDEFEYQTMEPGTFVRLRPGEEVTFTEPSAGGGHAELIRQFEQNIAVGAGITYDQLTGDLSKANFASLRAGKIEFRRDLAQIQNQFIIPMLCEPTARAVDAIGQAAGLWGPGTSKAVWMPPRNEPIDPKKDTDAELSDVTAGFESWSDTVSRRGHNPRTLAEKHKADDTMLKELGLARFIPNAGGAKPAAAPEQETETVDE